MSALEAEIARARRRLAAAIEAGRSEDAALLEGRLNGLLTARALGARRADPGCSHPRHTFVRQDADRVNVWACTVCGERTPRP